MKHLRTRLTLACVWSICAVAPAHVSADARSVWDVIQVHTRGFEQIVLASGYTNAFSKCGNGSDQFTAFVPLDSFIDEYLRSQDVELIDLLGSRSLADAFMADHIVNGHLSTKDLLASETTHVVTWSGRALVKEIGPTDVDGAEIGVNVLINGQFIIHYAHACNGMVYFLHGAPYGTMQRVIGLPTEPANFVGSPRGAEMPVRPEFYEPSMDSELPDTQ